MPLTDTQRLSASTIREAIAAGTATPELVRSALARIPDDARDPWIDHVFGLDGIPPDGADLPRGCAPYLPCSIDRVTKMIHDAGVHSGDVFVDIGSGLGRAAIATHLLTGATVIGLEVQAHLALASRELSRRLGIEKFRAVHGDAVELDGEMARGSVFFLYCPFGGERLDVVLDRLEHVARERPIRVCCVDLPLPSRPWLAPVTSPHDTVAVYRSTPRAGD